jgi:iron complex transport system ATP-binding protein
VVLEGLNLSAERGDLVCVLGPNGIGKSTLLRTMARMQPPLSGSIALDGTPLQSMTPADLARHLAVVLTEHVTIEALSARRVVEWGRYPHSGWFGGLNDDDRRVVTWAIEAAGAAHVAGREFSRLSDGERQRVMIARALAQEPAVLVLDEPTAFLDPASQVEIMELLRRLARDAHVAVVVSTHDLDVALRIADVVWLVMPAGDLLVGAPEDLLLAGSIARAFEGGRVRFCPESRTFRVPRAVLGGAAVRGSGIRAAMASAVVERAGYAVEPASSDWARLSVETHDAGWRAAADGGEGAGADFASLASWLRRREQQDEKHQHDEG